MYFSPRPRRIAIVAVLPLLFIAIRALLGNSTTPPPAKTGAPGNGTCAECHTGTANNPGRVLLDFGRLSYTPGVKLKIGVHVLASSQPGLTGFQLTARMASNEQLQAGHFEASGTSAVQVFNGIEYVNHVNQTSTQIYVFDWTAPATDVGNVKFYVAAVAGETTPGPDPNVYTAVYSLPAGSHDLPAGYSTQTFTVAGANTFVQPNGISSNGIVAGSYNDATNHHRGFVRLPSTQTATFNVTGAVDTIPSGVNAAGKVVGSWQDSAGKLRGFIRDANGTITVVDIPGASKTELFDINDAGLIVGRFVDAAGVTQALSFTDPANFSFRSDFSPTGLNSAGDQIGQINLSAFLLTNTGSFIGTSMCQAAPIRGITFALRLNSFRDIAGSCFAQNQFLTFVIAENGRTLQSSNMSNTFRAINDAGQVVGQKSDNSGLQQGAILTPCATSPAATSVSISGTAGSGVIVLSGGSGCVPNASSTLPWFRFGAPDGQNATYSYFADANPTGLARSGTVWLAGKTVTITQEGAACNVILSGGPSSFQSNGGTGTLNITAPEGCAWTASSNASWVTLDRSSGSLPGTLNFTVALNTDTNLRNGTINVGSSTFSILQTGGSTCSFSVVPTTNNLSSLGGTIFINVFTASNCLWSVSNTANWITLPTPPPVIGSGTVTLNIAQNFSFESRSATLNIAGQNVLVAQSGTGSTSGLAFTALPPCRIMETRPEYNFEGRTGAFGPPFMAAGETRTLTLNASSVCPIPATARAYVFNVTLIPRGSVDFLTLWPGGETRPDFTTVRSPDGQIVANAAIVKAGNGAISVYASGNADVLIDISGYFNDPVVGGSNIVYYPLTPCRVIETRSAYRSPAGPFGPPTMNAAETRRFRFPETPYCPVPQGAVAYSVTLTVVPPAALPYMTVWPAGSAQPLVSSINSFAGRILANNVIVPASADGSIDVYANTRTDFLMDINGYFAADNGTGLYYFPVTQCRVNDSNFSGGIYPDDSTRTIAVPTSGNCFGVPTTAKGYALNVTAVPGGSPMPYLTAYPTGQARPIASILNAFEGQTVTNFSIIPSGVNGAIDVYAYRRTHVIVELSGYFGR